MDPNGSSGVPLGNAPTADVYNNNNQISGVSYDQAGNQLVVNGNTLGYDAENRMTSAYDPNTLNTETYVYDGNGQRVQKSGPGGTTTYVYDAFGNLAAEYGSVAAAPCATCYLSYDHLGSVRLVTDASGSVVARHDFLPFGQEVPGGTVGRNGPWGATSDVEQKFTGKIRDQETGLDFFGARYYGSALGRFTSPDPVIVTTDRLKNPQQLNLYAYVANNPLRFVDPTGEILQCVGSADQQKQCFADLQQIAGDDANRLSIDAKSGLVSFDSKGLDLSKNEGAALVNDLVGSKNTYDLSIGPTVMTDKGPMKVDYLIENLPTFGDQRKGGNPPAGVSDIVGLYFANPKVRRVSNTGLKLAQSGPLRFTSLPRHTRRLMAARVTATLRVTMQP